MRKKRAYWHKRAVVAEGNHDLTPSTSETARAATITFNVRYINMVSPVCTSLLKPYVGTSLCDFKDFEYIGT